MIGRYDVVLEWAEFIWTEIVVVVVANNLSIFRKELDTIAIDVKTLRDFLAHLVCRYSIFRL